MKLHTLLMVGFALVVAGCAEKEKVVAPEENHTESTAPGSVEVGTESFVRHMHHHARRLEQLNAALAAGDLDAAQTPAYWLWAHEKINGAPDDWQPYLEEMSDAADAVTDAPDLTTARSAAQRVAESCEGCHAFAGVEIPTLGLTDE